MATRPLPVIDPDRTEFGFSRTACACDDCTWGCYHMPGYLTPADLERLWQHLSAGEGLAVWAARRLLASPGAIVARRGRVFRIPTPVPARRADGACTFLTEDGRRGVHAVAPHELTVYSFPNATGAEQPFTTTDPEVARAHAARERLAVPRNTYEFVQSEPAADFTGNRPAAIAGT